MVGVVDTKPFAAFCIVEDPILSVDIKEQEVRLGTVRAKRDGTAVGVPPSFFWGGWRYGCEILVCVVPDDTGGNETANTKQQEQRTATAPKDQAVSITGMHQAAPPF